MDERRNLGRLLDQLENTVKKLEIRYEQYFAGIEKREPINEREEATRQLYRFVNRRIIQTDLRFKCQNLATRFHSYCNYWDRTLRLIEEGRYHRGAGRPTSAPPTPAVKSPASTGNLDYVYEALVKAHVASGSGSTLPEKTKIAAFLEQQQSKIREKFGDREVEFQVTSENGKPKIKVRAK
jgi:hypothetical protein